MAKNILEEDNQQRNKPVVEGFPADFVLNINGFEGPIDILLALAREQKVDLVNISILELAEQYLVFVQNAVQKELELAADYLVMAAWLAFLKSKLLLPVEEEIEPSASEMAEALRWQLLRLESMQMAGNELMALPRKQIDFFYCGQPEGLPTSYQAVFDTTLYDVLRAYGRTRTNKAPTILEIEPIDLYSIEDAVQRLKDILPNFPDWVTLKSFMPEGLLPPLKMRSAVSTTLLAALELVREGKANIRQDGGAYSPIFVKFKSD
ncbi:MAG: segregation/condensation protein A [Rhodospirillaceae bacterium]|nr:segregation/condensation protein A [Rhodospirillaceae bacterium]